MQKPVLYGMIAAAVVAAAAAGISLAATSSVDSTSGTGPASQPASDSSSTAAVVAAQPRIIKHVMGETEIRGAPERVVVIDSELAENMLTLGVRPLGASMWEVFGTSFEEEMQSIGLQVPEGITDIGDYWAPNLESIAELEPDLIVTSDPWSREVYDDLDAIAPTLMFTTYPSQAGGTTTMDDMERDFLALADAFDMRSEGAEIIDRLYAKLDDAAAKIEGAGLKGHKFLIAEVWMQDGKPAMYLYTKNSIASQALERIGLQNALTGDRDAEGGLITTGVEGVASLDDPDLHFFYGYYDTINKDSHHDIRDIVNNGAVMQSLEFIKRDQAYALGPEFKPRPTPRHVEVMVNKVVDSLVGNTEARTITHAMGETTIVGTPKRIVALDWSASENLLAMGVSPIAVTNLESMKQFLKPEGLAPQIIDVGNSFEPNLEKIAELEPDLILAETFQQTAIYDELSAIAPTVMYSNAPPLEGSLTHLQSLEQNIMLVAEAANIRDRGMELVERLHSKYDEAEKRLEAAGLKGAKFAVGAVDPPYGEYTTSTLRLFDREFFMSQILGEMGLENVVTEKYGRSEWSMKVVGLEGLAAVDSPDLHFFYIHGEGQDAIKGEWKDNPVWANLEIAKNGHSHSLGPLYVYGGPKQMEELADKVVEALVGKN